MCTFFKLNYEYNIKINISFGKIILLDNHICINLYYGVKWVILKRIFFLTSSCMTNVHVIVTNKYWWIQWNCLDYIFLFFSCRKHIPQPRLECCSSFGLVRNSGMPPRGKAKIIHLPMHVFLSKCYCDTLVYQ